MRSVPASTGISRAIAGRWIPSEAEASARGVGRQRQSLSRERVRLTLRGKSLARLRGLSIPAEWWQERVFPKLELPDDLRDAVGELAAHPVIDRCRAIRPHQTSCKPQPRPSLPSFLGAMTWELLRREVGDWKRFRNRRQVASYTGLCPSEHSSGHSRMQGSITRHGNPRIRHLLIEAAWRRLLRNQTNLSRRSAKWREAFLATPVQPAARRSSSRSRASSPSTFGVWPPAVPPPSNSASPRHNFGAAGRPASPLGVLRHARCLLDRAARHSFAPACIDHGALPLAACADIRITLGLHPTALLAKEPLPPKTQCPSQCSNLLRRGLTRVSPY